MKNVYEISGPIQTLHLSIPALVKIFMLIHLILFPPYNSLFPASNESLLTRAHLYFAFILWFADNLSLWVRDQPKICSNLPRIF